MGHIIKTGYSAPQQRGGSAPVVGLGVSSKALMQPTGVTEQQCVLEGTRACSKQTTRVVLTRTSRLFSFSLSRAEQPEDREGTPRAECQRRQDKWSVIATEQKSSVIAYCLWTQKEFLFLSRSMMDTHVSVYLSPSFSFPSPIKGAVDAAYMKFSTGDRSISASSRLLLFTFDPGTFFLSSCFLIVCTRASFCAAYPFPTPLLCVFFQIFIELLHVPVCFNCARSRLKNTAQLYFSFLL